MRTNTSYPIGESLMRRDNVETMGAYRRGRRPGYQERERPGLLVCAAAVVLTTAAACKFPYPADVPDDDAPRDSSVVDTAGDGPLDGPTDAAVDAPIDAHVRNHPLVENNQLADLVIGQPDFTSEPPGTEDAQHVLYPFGITGDANDVWISEPPGSSRAVRFTPFPASNFPSAAGVVGRANLTTSGGVGAASATNASSPDGIALTSASLILVDSGFNRVLVWRPPPVTNGAAADLVLGQRNFTESTTGTAANQMHAPSGVWSDGVRLVVGDSGNHRLLIWNAFPTSNGQPADIVIGQPAFNMGSPPAVPSASRLRAPTGITSDGQWLAVSDSGHNRVLVWRTFPTDSGTPADIVIGQDSFDAAVDDVSTARHFHGVQGLATADGALFVADKGHGRVLVFDPVPSSSLGDVSVASQSLGQDDPGVLSGHQPVTQRSLNTPHAVAVIGHNLFVSEWSATRVLRFRLDLP